MRKKHWMSMLLAVLIVLLLISGCSGNQPEEEPEQQPVSNEPLTLRLLRHGPALSNEEFQTLFAGPVKKAYPNITLEFINGANTGPQSPDALLASGSFPDLIFASSRTFGTFTQLSIPLDLNDLVQKNRMDLGKFDPLSIEAIRDWDYGDRKKLYGIPMFINFAALFYNKDIFDKFAVSYPKDGMTWEETIELGKKLARNEDGVEYQGLNLNGISSFASGLSPYYADPKTGKAKLVNDQWSRILRLYKANYDIPGNKEAFGTPLFMKDKVLAMWTTFGARLGELEEVYKQGDRMNWDVASYPSFKELPGRASEIDVHFLAISSTSEHQDEAFKVISLLTDEENQLAGSRLGRPSAWKDPKMKETFGSELLSLKGKNISALFKSVPVVPNRTIYDDFVIKELNASVKKYLSGQTDLNTALREAEEAANQAISAQFGK